MLQSLGDGTPNKFLTPESRAEFIQALRDGAHLSTACKLVRLSPGTYRNWRTYAEKGTEPYAEFIAESDVAEAEGEMHHIRVLRRASEGKVDSDAWRASAEFLKRRHGDRWNRGWSPVEADAPDSALADMGNVLADQTKTDAAAALVETLLEGDKPERPSPSEVVPSWIRGSGEQPEVEGREAPGADKPRAARGSRRKKPSTDS